MKKFWKFCRTTLLPVLLVLAVWYVTRVLPAQGSTAAPQTPPAQTQSAAASAAAEGNAAQTPAASAAPGAATEAPALDESGSYTARDDIALYLVTYGHLPQNFITKREAEALGWDSKAGNLAEVAPGKSIGGDKFGNYEGGLPEKSGRKWYECDVGYTNGYRSATRILYASDGLVYYTDDHYKTFTQLY